MTYEEFKSVVTHMQDNDIKSDLNDDELRQEWGIWKYENEPMNTKLDSHLKA